MTDPVRSIVARADALMQRRRAAQENQPEANGDGIPVLTIDFEDVPTLTEVAEQAAGTDPEDDIPVLTLALDDPDLDDIPTLGLPEAEIEPPSPIIVASAPAEPLTTDEPLPQPLTPPPSVAPASPVFPSLSEPEQAPQTAADFGSSTSEDSAVAGPLAAPIAPIAQIDEAVTPTLETVPHPALRHEALADWSVAQPAPASREAPLETTASRMPEVPVPEPEATLAHREQEVAGQAEALPPPEAETELPQVSAAGPDLALPTTISETLPEEEPAPPAPTVDLEALSHALADQVRARLLAELPTLVEAALQSTLHELTETLKSGLQDTTDAALKDFLKSHIKPITTGHRRS